VNTFPVKPDQGPQGKAQPFEASTKLQAVETFPASKRLT